MAMGEKIGKLVVENVVFVVHFSAAVFLNLLQEVRSVSAQVVVIATVWYRNHLNQYLLQSRGFHVFDKTLELHPPTMVYLYSTLVIHPQQHYS